jgi:hypothetical protein
VSVLNRHERDEQVCGIRLDGLAPRALRRLTLTAAAAADANTASAPDRVAVTEVDAAPGKSELAFPPHSLTLLEYRM